MNAPIGIFTTTPDGRYLSVNNTLARMHGYDSPRQLMDSITDISTQIYVDPADRDELKRLLEKYGKVTNFECRLRHRSGKYFWVSENISKIKDEHENTIGYQGFNLDITERKNSEEALLQSELRACAQRAAIADLSLDKDVLEGELSSALERITERVTQAMNIARAGIWILSDDRTELRCLSLYEAAPNRHGSGMVLKTTTFPRYFEAILSESRIYAHDAQNDPRTSELSEKYLFPLNITSMLDAGIQIDGRLAGIVCLEHVGEPRRWHSDEEAFSSTIAALVAQVMANVRRRQAEEDREKLQSQLLQAQKMESVGIMAGGVAHDFNNLLHTMRGNLELMTRSGSLDSRNLDRLKTVSRSIDRAAQLVQQLLLFSRKVKSSKVQVDVNQEVQDVVQILKRTIPKMITLDLRLNPDVHSLSGDPAQIEQIILNLANNAVDAMPEGGRLTIETSNVEMDADIAKTHPESSLNRYVLLAVSDTGCGMDDKTLKHIYDPFFTTKEVGKGTGLGLPSVYGIAKAHGGFIDCSSEVGKGTAFRVYLPVLEQEQERETTADQQSETEPQGGNETILVVDDEIEILELTQEILEEFGYTVINADSGEKAIEKYRKYQQKIDLILMDLNMPGMGGHKCLQELLKIDPSVNVIIASGYTANSRVQDVFLAGAKGFIGKPYQLAELLVKIRETLDAALCANESETPTV
ncbi:MAG: response regulator [Desulfonatronovibrio sp.]